MAKRKRQKMLVSLLSAAMIFLSGCGKHEAEKEMEKRMDEKKKEITPPAEKEKPIAKPDDKQQPGNKPAQGGEHDSQPEAPSNNRPQNIIASRIQVREKKGVDMLKFDIEPLMILGYQREKDSQYNMDYISQFAEFYYVTPATSDTYVFNQEDLKKMEVQKVEIKGNSIVLWLTYNGTDIVYDRQNRPKLYFDLYKYIESKIVPNTQYIRNKFMRGEAEDFSGDVGNLFLYNQNYYELENCKATAVDNNNTMNYSFDVKNKRTGDEIMHFNSTLSGFRPLSDLKDVMEIRYTRQFKEDCLTRLKNKRNGIKDNNDHQDVATLFPNIENIMKSAEFYNKKSNKPMRTYGNEIRGGAGYLDILLQSPRWELTSAYIKDHNLFLEVKMIYVNETTVNIPFKIIVPAVYPADTNK